MDKGGWSIGNHEVPPVISKRNCQKDKMKNYKSIK